MNRVLRLALATLLVAPLLSPLAAQSLVDEGRALFDKGQYATARARFESAAAANVRDAVARYWWGRALLAEDKAGPAAERFEQAIAIDAGKAEYHFWAGNAYGAEAQRANRFRQALLARRVKAAFERAVALDPTLIDARSGLMGYYLFAPGFMGGSLPKAKEQAIALMALDPFLGREGLANVAMKQDDLAGAERELATLLRDFPDSGRAVTLLGNFYADHARPADALRVFEQWVAKHPKDPLGYYGIGRTAAVTGQQLDRGVAALQMARALPPAADESVRIEPATITYRLGMIHEKAGRMADAKAAYAEVLKLEPGHKGAREGLKRVS